MGKWWLFMRFDWIYHMVNGLTVCELESPSLIGKSTIENGPWKVHIVDLPFIFSRFEKYNQIYPQDIQFFRSGHSSEAKL